MAAEIREAETGLHDSNLRAGPVWTFWQGTEEMRMPVSARFTVNSVQALCRLLLVGRGVGMCPDYAVAGDLAAGRLVPVLPDLTAGALDIHAVISDARHMPARVRAVLDHLVTTFRPAPWRGAGRSEVTSTSAE